MQWWLLVDEASKQEQGTDFETNSNNGVELGTSVADSAREQGISN